MSKLKNIPRYLSSSPLNNMSEEKKSESDSSGNDKLMKEMLKPVTGYDSELEDEIKELEVENSGGYGRWSWLK